LRSFDFRCATSIEKFQLVDEAAKLNNGNSKTPSLPLLSGTSSKESQLAAEFPHLMQQTLFPDFESVRSEAVTNSNTIGGSGGGSGNNSSGNFVKIMMEIVKDKNFSNDNSVKLKMAVGTLETSIDKASFPDLISFGRVAKGHVNRVAAKITASPATSTSASANRINMSGLPPLPKRTATIKQPPTSTTYNVFFNIHEKLISMKKDVYPSIAISAKFSSLNARFSNNGKPVVALSVTNSDIALARTVVPHTRGQFDIRVSNFQIIELASSKNNPYEIFGSRPPVSMDRMTNRLRKPKPLFQLRARSQLLRGGVVGKSDNPDWVVGKRRPGDGDCDDTPTPTSTTTNTTPVYICHVGARVDSPCVDFIRKDLDNILVNLNDLKSVTSSPISVSISNTGPTPPNTTTQTPFDFRVDFIAR